MEEIIRRLKSMISKKIFVQFPEGLKPRIQKIEEDLEKEGFDTVICLERNYGACDIKEKEAGLLGCDTILNIGHADFGTPAKMPVVYWDYFIDVDPLPILEKEYHKLGGCKNIGLVASLQFVPAMEKVRKYLESHGKKTFSGKTEQHVGQILGCRVGAGKSVEDRVDCFLCIGAGKFYPLGLALKTDKPVFSMDLEQGRISSMDDDRKKMSKLAAWNRAAFKDAKKAGLLVSFKSGQYRDPFPVKNALEGQGKKVYILAMDEFAPDKLEGLDLDVLINLACPRIGTDNLGCFKIPMINWTDTLA